MLFKILERTQISDEATFRYIRESNLRFFKKLHFIGFKNTYSTMTKQKFALQF